jgi:nuclear pore complex protein Nup85
VLLFSPSEACVLLQKLEEVHVRAIQGSGDDYLSVLRRTIKGGSEKDALERLKTVRLAIARYFASCTVTGFRGKQLVDKRPYVLVSM